MLRKGSFSFVCKKKLCSGGKCSKGLLRSGLGIVLNLFHAPENLSTEQMIRFRPRHPKRSLNQTEWYMSKRLRLLKKLNHSGLRLFANCTAPWPCWGINVPMIEAIARMIRITIVNLTELKKRHKIFDFLSVLDDVIIF